MVYFKTFTSPVYGQTVVYSKTVTLPVYGQTMVYIKTVTSPVYGQTVPYNQTNFLVNGQTISYDKNVILLVYGQTELYSKMVTSPVCGQTVPYSKTVILLVYGQRKAFFSDCHFTCLWATGGLLHLSTDKQMLGARLFYGHTKSYLRLTLLVYGQAEGYSKVSLYFSMSKQ